MRLIFIFYISGVSGEPAGWRRRDLHRDGDASLCFGIIYTQLAKFKLAVISCSTVLYGCGLCAVSTLALVLVGEKRIKVNRFMMQR